MQPYVKTKDLYRFKLALIIKHEKKVNKVLKEYPTERKFKEAPSGEIAKLLNIKNNNSSVLKKLNNIDSAYDKLVTFKPNSNFSKSPRAKRIMGIDTEYLKSDLDSVQYVITEDTEFLTSGIIFTNKDIAPSVNTEKGINYLRNIINDFNPDLIVGHNFQSDISVLESAYGDILPELYFYDDTMFLMEESQLANILGGSGLNKAVKEIFQDNVIDLFSAYGDFQLFVEYGLKDAIYPILLRDYIVNNRYPDNFEIKLETILKEENRRLLDREKFNLSFDN